MKKGVMEEVKRIFKPEFINRIDEIMVFHSLDKENMIEIISLLASNIARRCKKQMNIKVSFSQHLKKHIVEKYADVKMGARPLKRALQTAVEDKLAEEILAGKVKAGDEVHINWQQEEIVFTVNKHKED
jgi:ATP-dependent Clp protease ATP-binding subunit ClpC